MTGHASQPVAQPTPMSKKRSLETKPVPPAPDVITIDATDKSGIVNASPRYSLGEILNIGEFILKDPEEAISQLLNNEESSNCWHLIKRKLHAIPKQIVVKFQHIWFYNWMVDANKLMDDPNTQMYEELPHYLHRLAKSMNFPLGDIDIEGLKTDSLIFSLPRKGLRSAFSPGYFEKNPSLFLIKRNKITGVTKSYLLTIGFENPTESRICGPPQHVRFGTLSSKKTDVCASFTPLLTREAYPDLLDLQINPNKGVVLSTPEYRKRFKIGIPAFDSSTKQMQQNIRHLTPCEVTKRVFSDEPILISMQETNETLGNPNPNPKPNSKRDYGSCIRSIALEINTQQTAHQPWRYKSAR